MTFCDVHIHIAQSGPLLANEVCCSCAHSKEEFPLQAQRAAESSGRIFCAFGLHPQNPDIAANAPFLEELLSAHRICAVGECGFDFYNEEFKSAREKQKEAFEVCVDLALRYGVPLIIHNRKALDMIFAYQSKLRKAKAVVFHSFAFTLREADAILKHGIAAYFSFGKVLLAGGVKAASCVRELPLDHILLETDAPFQTLRGESRTEPADIVAVYKKVCSIRAMQMEELCGATLNTFTSVFGA